MNIIQQYELRYINFEQLSEELCGYGQVEESISIVLL